MLSISLSCILQKRFLFLISILLFSLTVGLSFSASTLASANNNATDTDANWRVQFWNGYYNDTPWGNAPCKNEETINTVPFVTKWGSIGPGGGCSADTFTIRFERRFDFTGGSYRFHCHRDSYCRISLPELNLLPDGADGGAFGGMDWSADIPAGNHLLRIDYSHRQSNGDSRIEFWWQGPESYLPPRDVNCDANPTQWCGAYRLSWDSPSNSYMLRRLENTEFLNWDWGNGSPGVGIFNDFSAEWQRTIDFATGTYRFHLTADESAKLQIFNSTGSEVLNIMRNCCTEHTFDYDASAGDYKLIVNWLDSGGNAAIKLSWELLATPTNTSTPVPPTATFTFTSTPTDTPTSTPTQTPTNTPSPTISSTITPTIEPISTFTPTPTPTSTDTPSPTDTLTLPPTFTPTPTFTPLPPSHRALVLLYAALDNNLQANWTQLVNHIEAGVTQNANVRLYIDGPGSKDAYIYDMQADSRENCPNSQNIPCDGKYILDTNLFVASEDSAAPMTLANFISESVKLYPDAPQLIVGLIGHGSGWSAGVLPGEGQEYQDQPRPWNEQPGALLWDDHPAQGKEKSHSLSIHGLNNAFYWAYQVTGRQIDLLYMDGCSLSMVEIAYEVRNHVHYMLASPNTDWTSFGYNKLLPAINPKTLNARALGEKWLQIDAEMIRAKDGQYPFTYALTDLSKMEPLKEEVHKLAEQLRLQLPSQKNLIYNAFLNTDHYESDYNGLINEDDAYSDLKSFAMELQNTFPITTGINQSAQRVLNALDSTVVTRTVESGTPPISDDAWEWKNYGGLGIYLPLGYDEERRKFYNQEEIIWLHENSWDEFLSDYLPSLDPLRSTSDNRVRPLLICETTTDTQCEELAQPLSLEQHIYLPLIGK